MASGRLSFSIALNLATNQFKQGAEQVKNALRNIQYQVLGMASALGAGAFGVSELVSRFVDVARETNRARMALRNISGEASTFGKNISFLTDLAQQYGQDLNTLTSNFARFSAASNAASVGLADQYKIYSAVTKSVTAFGLSGEEANLTFMALGQMMSKGKISSEELRRQMGERIPIAMQAMASAAGVSIQQLDKMLKNGEIYSKDILPKFADELNKLTGSINVDNIETSVNRLRTAFIKLTEDLKIGEFYKKIVDGATKMLSTVQSLLTTFAGVVLGGVLTKIIKGYLNYQASAMASHTKVVLSARKAAWEEALAGRDLTKKQQIEIIKRATSINAAYLNSAGVIKRFGITAVTAFRTIGAALASIAPAVLLMAIGAVSGRFIELNRRAKETAKIFEDYANGFNALNGGQEAEKLKQLKKLSDQYKGSKDGINSAQVELMKMLGLQKGKEEQINRVIADRLVMLEQTERFDYELQSKMDAEKKKREVMDKYGGVEGYNKAVTGYNEYNSLIDNSKYGNTKAAGAILGVFDKVFGGKGSNSSIKSDIDAVGEYNKVISSSTVGMDIARSIMLKYKSTGTNTDPYKPTGDPTGSGNNKEKTPIQKAEEDYTEGMLRIKNQIDAKIITGEEYKKAVGELSKKTTEEIAGILGVNAANNEIYKKAKDGLIPELTAFEKAQKEHTDKEKELTNLKNNGVIGQEEYTKRLNELIKSTIDTVGSLDNIGEAGKKYIGTLKGGITATLPTLEKRDTTFDYKKTELEKLQEQYDIVKDHWNDLKEKAPQAIAEIANKEKELTTLSEALKVTELKEDLENLNKNIFSESIDGITGFANSIDSIANSWERVANADMSGWDRMIAIINALGDSVKGLTGAWETYKTIKELIDTKEKVSTALSLANSGKKIAASGSEATADLVAGTAKTFKANAEIPVIGAGIAIAGVASILALIAGLPKFAEGGIIGGSSYSGDKVLGRFNSGERVLTKPDQAYLTKVLKGGATGGGSVEFKIKGKELVGILSQEQTRARR